mgnify:CR=1 FL=1
MAGTQISGPVARARGRVAGLSRDRSPDDPEFLAARRDLAALTLEEHVERVLAKAPPLTDEQAERIARRLRGVL